MTATPAGKLFTFTIDADTAHIVKFELLDASGTRREPSDAEKATLAAEGGAGGLEDFITRAFEAGIVCALGDDAAHAESEAPEETDEDKTLRRMLLRRLIERSDDMRDLLQREAQGRMLLETLIHHSIHQPPLTGGQSAGAPSDRTAQARTN